MKRIETYNPFDIVVVPFPFSDKSSMRKRPALTLSSKKHQRESMSITLMMITTAKNSEWKSDYPISQLKPTGLTADSIVRQKIFSIDLTLAQRKIGKLHKADREELVPLIEQHMPIHRYSS